MPHWRHLLSRPVLGYQVATVFDDQSWRLHEAAGHELVVVHPGVAGRGELAFGFPVAFNPLIVCLAALSSVGIGFGLFPAWEAALKDPVEALRS